MAACGVRGQRQEVSGGQGAQAAQEDRALFEPGQRLDQPGAVVTDGGQRDLDVIKKTRNQLHCVCFHRADSSVEVRH